MTDNLPKVLEEELTCHICTDIYKAPVQLPCQHSFCRECLKQYVSSDTTTHSANDNASNRPPKGERAVGRAVGGLKHSASCPVCRKPVELDCEAVCKLPLHFTIANIVEKYHTEVKKDASPSPKCSMCEGDYPNTAIKGCVTCKCLYCQDCLKVMHPMRGPLAKHSLVAVENYALTPVCEEHIEPLKVFCNDCKNVYCLMCIFEKHTGHELKKPGEAFNKEKDRLVVKTNELKELQQQLHGCFKELSRLEDDIRNSSDGQAAEVESKYQDILKALENWKYLSLETINEERDKLFRQVVVETKKLEAHFNKSMTFVKSAADLASLTNIIGFLVLSEATVKGIDLLSNSTGDVLQKFKNTKKTIEGTMTGKKDSGELRHLVDKKADGSSEFRVIHRPILCPEFALTKEIHNCISVRDKGKLLVNVRTCAKMGPFCGALADQSYQEGRLYWETDITYAVKVAQKANSLVYSAGVLHQGKPSSLCLGIDSHSWGITLQQKSPYSFVCGNNNIPACSLPVFSDGNTQGGTVRLGFYLDCSGGTLTILDCTHDRLVHTFHNVDISEPLTPAISVYNSDSVDVSVQLRTGQDITSLSTCLYSMLHGL